MQKAGRLVQILLLMQAYGSITAQELAEKLDVSVRTIYRDIEAMYLWGVPIESDSGPGGGYRLPEGYSIDPSMFTSSEVTMLGEGSIFIQSFTDFIEDPQKLEDAKAKLLSILSEEERLKVGRQIRYIFFDNSRWYRDYFHIDKLKALKDSVVSNRQVMIEFHERDDPEKAKVKVSLVDPFGLVYKSDTWYLIGYSHQEKKLRRWNTTRILKIQETESLFIRPPDFCLPDWWKEELEKFGEGDIRVLLKIDKSAWSRFTRVQWKKKNRLFDMDSHIVIELMVDRYEWIIDLVMVNRGDVEVLEPLQLRSKIQQAAKSIVQRHEGKYKSKQIEKHIVDLEVLSLTDNRLD